MQLSLLLKVNEKGTLITLDIKKPSGEITIAGKEWEEAITYTIMLEGIRELFNKNLWDKRN